MRKKFQNIMFEVSYVVELLISALVTITILIAAVRMIIDMLGAGVAPDGAGLMMKVLDDAIILAIGAELIKMFCKHTPETVIEVIAFALARQLIVGHAAPLENLITIVAIAILFAVRRFFLNRHDMVETPDGFVGCDENEAEQA